MNQTTDEEERGITMADIFRTIFTQKWLALIIAAVIAIGGTLAMYFGYNVSKLQYVSTFTIDFPGSDKDEPKFPDNTPFNYRNIISVENLKSVVEDDDELKNIPVEDMFAEGNITISRDVVELVKDGMKDVSYTVSVSAKYFNGKAQAARFINRLANIPINYVMTLITGQDAYLEAYVDETDYEKKIEYLEAQLNYLSNKFGELQNHIKDNDYNSIVNRINAFRTQLNSVVGVLHTEYYVASANTLEYYKTQIAAMREQSIKKTEELKLLFGSFDGKTPDSSVILGGQASSDEYVRSLAQDISELNTRITTYQSFIEKGNVPENTPESFITSLATIYTEIKALTDNYITELEKYYQNVTAVAYGGAPAEEVGGMQLTTCILISVIAGILFACLVAYIVGAIKAGKTGKADKPADKTASAATENNP